MGRFNDEFPNWTRKQFVDNWVSRVATEVHARRNQLGLTQSELALSAGIHPDTVRKIESAGHDTMQFSMFLSICHGLEVMPAEALGHVNMRPKISPSEYQLILQHRKLFPAV